jgi:cation:H+ antiporter
VLVLAVLVPAVAIAAVGPDGLARLRLPGGTRAFLGRALRDEALEVHDAQAAPPASGGDWAVAGMAIAAVIAASVAMERTASELGSHYGLSEIVVGGVILAAVTSLPNAVAAVHLARRGRGAATLSEAMHSNTLNVAIGLLLPALFVGFGADSSLVGEAAAWYAGLTLLALVLAYAGRGLGRGTGAAVVVGYVAFVGFVAWR